MFGLGITQQLFEVDIPFELQQKITSDWVVSSYVHHAKHHLFPTTEKQKQVKQRKLFAIFRLGLLSGMSAILLRLLMLLQTPIFAQFSNLKLIAHLFTYLLTPNSSDWQYVSLPKYLYPLYYLIRPIRLVMKLFSTSLARATEKNICAG